jgi:hypothetical protein
MLFRQKTFGRLVQVSTLFHLGWLGLVFQACTGPAEHGNPLDPQSPHYTTQGNITGQVTSIYPPYRPLPDAMIQLQPGGAIVQSDEEGHFIFAGLNPDTFSLEVSANGYQPATATVAVHPRQTSLQDFRLNALPVVQSAQVTSEHVATLEAVGNYWRMEVIAEAQDRDGAYDIRRVKVDIPAKSFSDTLARSTGAATWQRIFSPEELVRVDLLDLIGKPLQLVVEDFPGARVISEPFYLARVITEVPEAIFPAGGDTISDDRPTFEWQVPVLPFSHTFSVVIFRNEGGWWDTLATMSDLKAGTSSVRYPGRLSSFRNYYWTVEIIDAFGNSSRSKEATFTVQTP